MVKTLIASLRGTFNLSVAEVDHQDLWQRTAIGVSAVAGERYHLTKVMHEVERHVERFPGVELIDAAVTFHAPDDDEERTMGTGTRRRGGVPEISPIPRLKDPSGLRTMHVQVTPDFAGIVLHCSATTRRGGARAQGSSPPRCTCAPPGHQVG